MENIIDMHHHSQFSPDSKQLISSYIERDDVGVLTFTDHLDFWQCANKQDVVLDYESYIETVNSLNSTSKVKFYTGVEVGYHMSVESETIQYLSDKQFDIIILSVHQDGEQDYLYTDDNYVVDINNYLANVLDGLYKVDGITTLGHLDYPFRSNHLDENFWTNSLLFEIIDSLIEKEIALEVNTRSLYQYNNIDFYHKLLQTYYKRGGRLIAIGSDGHVPKHYRFKFKEAITFINEIGNFEIINYKY